MKYLYKIIDLALSVSIASITLAVTDTIAESAEGPKSFESPIQLYGHKILFDVYRKDKRVGFHRVRFSQDAKTLSVESDFQLQLKILYVPVFRYAYRSESLWRMGQLDRLSVTLDDDGKRSSLDATRVGNRIQVDRASGSYMTDAPLFPTNHWNAAVLGQNRVLNTLTGRINSVRIELIVRETVHTERGDVPATRYAYTGDLETEVWYDDAGRWVKMRFAGRDGSPIEYICRRCQGGHNGQALK